MKRFAFSLQRMLGFKTTMYERERNVLAQLRAQRLALQQRRDDTEAQMLQLDAAFREKAAQSGVHISEVRQLSFHRENADKLIHQFEQDLARMDVAIEKQLQVVIELDKEVQSLEKLREAQWAEYQMDMAREERERILELVSAKYAQQQREEAEEEATDAQAARAANA